MTDGKDAKDKVGDSTVMLINGKEVDLSKALPLLWGDIKKIKRDHGIDMIIEDGGSLDIDKIDKIVGFVLKKANPDITTDDIDTIELKVLGQIATRAVNMSADEVTKDDRPT